MKLKHLLMTLILLPTTLLASEDDGFGVWTEVGLSKSITKKWDVGFDGEIRAQKQLRWSAGLSTSYKLNKYLKVGAFYSYINTHKPEKTKEKSDDDGREVKNFDSYWTNRHRFGIEMTGEMKFWKWLRVSLRERYQFTHRTAQSIAKHEYTYSKNPIFDDDWNVTGYEYNLDEEKDGTKFIESQNDQVIRTRIKLEVDKKHWDFSPFISAETHNSVTVGDHLMLQKVRAAIGTGYKINKHNSVSLAYLVTFGIYDTDDGEKTRIHDRMHTINIGYNYKF